MEVFYDKKGKRIYPYDILKVFHFYGRRVGKGFKKHFMYKQVKMINGKFVGCHLGFKENDYFWLKAIANKENMLTYSEIIQSPYSLALEYDLEIPDFIKDESVKR